MVRVSGSGFTGLARGHKICRFGVRSSSPPGVDSGFVQDMDGPPAWNVHWRNDQVDVLGVFPPHSFLFLFELFLLNSFLAQGEVRILIMHSCCQFN